MRIIVALSGGKASAYCAEYAFQNYKKEDIVLYFNDTKWEHPDLYRFIEDLAKYYDHPITYDSDGRSPDELFFKQKALANNRMPFCSRILKADRLQNYYVDGDIILFGIGLDEMHRASRIVSAYQRVAVKRKAYPKIKFPLIEKNTTSIDIDNWLLSINIAQPYLYTLGFSHNNCSGGCVRAGKKQWINLLEKLPDVYRQREEIEQKVREYLGKDVHILKDLTLRDLRLKIESQLPLFIDDEIEKNTHECIGICNTEN